MKAQQSVTDFANKHKLNWKIDPDDGTTVIPGHLGHIYEWDQDLLAVMYLSDNGTAAKWNNARRACIAAGMTLLQDGDTEGSLSFDPTSHEQAKLAIKVAHIKTERTLSPEALEKAKQRMTHARRFKQTQSTRPKNALLSDPEASNDLLPAPHAENVPKVANLIAPALILTELSADQDWGPQ